MGVAQNVTWWHAAGSEAALKRIEALTQQQNVMLAHIVQLLEYQSNMMYQERVNQNGQDGAAT